MVFSILVSKLIFSCAQKKEDAKNATPAALSEINKDFVKALNVKGAVAAANCYTEDAMILPPNEAPVKSRANIQKYWDAAIAAEAFDEEVATTTTGSHGD